MGEMLEANPGRPAGSEGEKMLERMNRSHEPLRRWAFEHVAWVPGMRILDVGCGGGGTIADMLVLSAGSVIDGLDHMEASIAAATATNRTHMGARVFLKRSDVTTLPYEAGTFDLVTAVETVYFWPQIDKALAEIHRVLKLGGQLMIACEGSDPDTARWKPEDDTPFVVYRPEELAALVSAAGFSDAVWDRGAGEYIVVTARV